jgi:outer membrane biosynthesis protein TonB
MKGSVLTSLLLHALVAAWLLVSFGSPKPFEVTMTEAMPVDLVPIEELTQLQQGDKEAPKKERSATEVTKREDPVPDAQNTGDNNFDLESVPTPSEKPTNVQEAGAEKPSEEVIPDQHITKAENVEDVLKEDTATEPSKEVAALEQPKVEVKPEPKPEPEVKDAQPVEDTTESLIPDSVPVPTSRPKTEPKKVEEKKVEKTEEKVAEAKPEKQPNRKISDKERKSAKSTTKKVSDFNTDEIAQLLNKTNEKPGGAKRNKQEKALGAKTATGGEKLSQSELDMLQGIVSNNWTIMPGQVTSSNIKIVVRFELDENGDVVGSPEVTSSGGDGTSLSALEGGARRAVMKSAPFDKLPKDKYEDWKVVELSFYPSEMM